MSQIGSRSSGGLVKIAVTTGGSGYTAPPTVTVSGGGGTGATLQAQLAGGKVQSVVVVSSGTGYTGSPTVSFSGGGGTGAAATAYAYTGPAQRMSFYKGRFNDLYGVDGMGRGIRWDGDTASVEKIGIVRPAAPPAVTASTTGAAGRITGVQIVAAGVGYNNIPTVEFTGGTPTTPAKAIANIANGQVIGVTITEPGGGYQATPQVSFTGGIASGAALSVGVLGKVDAAFITALGSGYTSNATTSPSITFSTAQGLTGAVATVSVNENGRCERINILSAGTGATTTGVTATISGGGGSGAQVAVAMVYSVASVTAASTGSGYMVEPKVTFRPSQADSRGDGAAATAQINTAGNLTGATVYAGGEYFDIPTAQILNTSAKGMATLSTALRGTYKCAIRYLDDTPESQGGPIPSSISDLVEIDAGSSSGSLTWTFTHYNLDDRVHAMELWRTTSGQSVVLFRVATIKRSDANFSTTYTDTLDDDSLKDTERDGYGLMPVTLPSGQLNARRFGVPPGEFAVATMFQDRAWYAVDVTGERPNSLLYSEVDEPESVPEENELVVQENTGSPDKIVALIPLASDLLIAQTAHLYKLSYVAQPVLDAAISLVGYRGILNARCWDAMNGVAFIADSAGLYGFDGTREEPVSLPVDNYWRDSIIDFSKSEQFHVSADPQSLTVRFFYCQSADAAPTRALCYCVATKAWWEETYPQAITASCEVLANGKRMPVYGLSGGDFVKFGGQADSGSPIAYQFRSGNNALTPEPSSRSISVLYTPTTTDATLNLSLHYNGSSTPRTNAVATNRGDGFTTTQGSTVAALNMNRTRSALGDATGFARAHFAGRRDDLSAGADTHVAVNVSGTQTTGQSVVLHGIAIEGAK